MYGHLTLVQRNAYPLPLTVNMTTRARPGRQAIPGKALHLPQMRPSLSGAETTARGSMHVCVSLLESTRARRGLGHACMHACMQSGGKTGTKEILKHACLGCPGVPKRPLVMKACPHPPVLTSPAATAPHQCHWESPATWHPQWPPALPHQPPWAHSGTTCLHQLVDSPNCAASCE